MTRSVKIMSCLAVCAVALTVLVASANQAADAAKGEFARTTIDLGVFCSDVEKSAKFYTEGIGFKEIDGFSVPGDFCADAGLTAGKELKIRVFVLGEGDTATKLKLMQLPGLETKKSDNSFVHSQFGYRYTTIYINDMNKALSRLQSAGVKPIAKSPVPLPKGLPEGYFLTLVHDPDGNFVELVGPKK